MVIADAIVASSDDGKALAQHATCGKRRCILLGETKLLPSPLIGLKAVFCQRRCEAGEPSTASAGAVESRRDWQKGDAFAIERAPPAECPRTGCG